MTAAAGRRIFGPDNSKFGRKAQTRTSAFEARPTIVTDRRPPPAVARASTAAGAKLILAAPQAAGHLPPPRSLLNNSDALSVTPLFSRASAASRRFSSVGSGWASVPAILSGIVQAA